MENEKIKMFTLILESKTKNFSFADNLRPLVAWTMDFSVLGPRRIVRFPEANFMRGRKWEKSGTV